MAQEIYRQGYADAMKAAALLMVSKKLDEVKSLLAAAGLNSNGLMAAPAAAPPAVHPVPPPPPVTNACHRCGRPGVYKSKPSQWNRTGSWFCRACLPLAGQIESEDHVDRSVNFATPPQAPPAVVPVPVPQPQPNNPLPVGASSLSEAMGMAQLDDNG